MKSTERFTGREDAYVVGRPSYPIEAIDLILDGLGDPHAIEVADVGAGTGISSRLIAARGPHVYAIEPNAAMRRAAAPDPRVTWVDGTAEHTTLPDASVDVFTAFQAWHWVDHPAGVSEARRIVRPGGRLAVAYNERDERDPFTREYGAIVRRYATDETERRRGDGLEVAATVNPAGTLRAEIEHDHELDRPGVHARMASTSYVPHAGPAADEVRAQLDTLLDRYAVDGRVTMRLRTIVVRVDL